jgi:hypothetical protein
LLIGARQVLKVADFNSRHNWDNDFIWFLLGFWEHPSTICRSYPSEIRSAPHWHEFHKSGGAGRFWQMNADYKYVLDAGCWMLGLKIDYGVTKNIYKNSKWFLIVFLECR